MSHNEFTFSGKVWFYPEEAGWHFVTIPQDISDEVRSGFGDRQRAWGSIPVTVRIGETEWKTSIFRDNKENAYLLPIKKEVRLKEEIQAGSVKEIIIRILRF